MTSLAFATGLAEEIDSTFRQHTELVDHRHTFPWLRGSLGVETAGAWFLSEAPSAWRVERDGPKEPRTFEDQWAISPGDREFRIALAGAHFKEGDSMAPGGWDCYITVLSKSMVDFGTFRHLGVAGKMPLFRKWAEVLQWELDHGSPQLLIAMGADTGAAMKSLLKEGLLRTSLPIAPVWSYGYLMRPSTERDERITEYRAQFKRVRATLDQSQSKEH